MDQRAVRPDRRCVVTLLLAMLPSFFLGVAVMGIVGIPIARRRAYNDGLEDARVLVGPALLREGDLPVQLGTLPEHQRRLRPPMQYVEILDSTALAVEQNPLGAEPAFGQVRVGVTGRTMSAIAVGNAAPTMEEEAPSQIGAPAGSSWPLSWQLLWPVLLFVACFWDTRGGRFVDRIGAWRWWLAHREPRWWVDYEIPARRPARHAAEELDGEAERRRRALFEPTQFLRLVDLPDFPDWTRYLGPGWRDAIEPIPVAQVGELVAR